ncbi:FAD-dependent oxidoreductase [Embleya sp. NBC_00888]|uniref:phytoene desaturase family protein n=1 Tax=Embleya sp. NBC_00888 TaxID=2975960 RepID=UPI0038635627|nr:FAD-dependent oxidoreductase [Embleya sp. NBC_00888]
MARIVVVGAGMGGLAVAARLATLRHEVTICERSSATGGLSGSIVRDGFTFTTGPGLLTLPAVYRDLFLKTGAAIEDVVDLVPIATPTRESFAAASGARTVVDIPNASRSGTHEAFESGFGPGAGDDWQRLLHRAGEMWGVTRKSFFEAPLLADPAQRAERLRSAGGRADLRVTAPWRSLRSLGRTHLGDLRLRAHLERFAAEAGCHPGKAPATLATLPYLEETFGVWWVRGGLHRMTEALHARCVRRKVKVRTDTEVVSIERAGGRVAGVLLADGGRLDADVVITDLPTDPESAGLLPAARTGGAGRVPASSAMLELHLALRGGAAGTPHRTYLFADDPGHEPDALFARRAAPPVDPTLCVLAPDDPALAPEGHSTWTVQLRVPRHGAVDWDSAAVRDAYPATVLDLMARRGLDVRDRVLWSELRTPADLAEQTGAPGGEVPGAGADGPRTAPRRVPNRSAVPGLFSVGASAHPGGGLTRVGMSAALVAELIGRA